MIGDYNLCLWPNASLWQDSGVMGHQLKGKLVALFPEPLWPNWAPLYLINCLKAPPGQSFVATSCCHTTPDRICIDPPWPSQQSSAGQIITQSRHGSDWVFMGVCNRKRLCAKSRFLPGHARKSQYEHQADLGLNDKRYSLHRQGAMINVPETSPALTTNPYLVRVIMCNSFIRYFSTKWAGCNMFLYLVTCIN